MMDLVFVTYNSRKWVGRCFASIMKSAFDMRGVHIYVVDNASLDGTLAALRNVKRDIGNQLGSFRIIRNKKNVGFGAANNIGFSAGKGELVCFLNIDTEVFPDTFQRLLAEVEKSDGKTAVWEFRQFPYEHPKIYDPLTRETEWCSGAAFAVRRSAYARVGGFDKKIFLYAEDVDLSWRLRAAGYTLKYVPEVKIWHHSYENVRQVKPNQHVYSAVNSLLLRYRFGDKRAILKGHLYFWALMARKEVFPGARKRLLMQYLRHWAKIPHFYSKGRYRYGREPIGKFLAWDYSQAREGAYYRNFLPEGGALVSIIVRTCQRPDALREALLSLRNQTYKNLEIIIVEDGRAVSEDMAHSEFGDLNILYTATGQKVGRSAAGNLGMRLASGKYLNFLDDDDLFFADHVEVLLANLEKSGRKAAYAMAFETPIEVASTSPYVYEVKGCRSVHRQGFDKVALCHHNYIPIQCMMFDKGLYEKYGGLDEAVDALEDWDLWVRYSLHTDFLFVPKTTSIYRVPADAAGSRERQKKLDDALAAMREKHKGYARGMSVYDVAMLYEGGRMGE